MHLLELQVKEWCILCIGILCTVELTKWILSLHNCCKHFLCGFIQTPFVPITQFLVWVSRESKTMFSDHPFIIKLSQSTTSYFVFLGYWLYYILQCKIKFLCKFNWIYSFYTCIWMNEWANGVFFSIRLTDYLLNFINSILIFVNSFKKIYWAL